MIHFEVMLNVRALAVALTALVRGAAVKCAPTLPSYRGTRHVYVWSNSNLFMISAPKRGNYRSSYLWVAILMVTVAKISAQLRPHGYLMCLELSLLKTTRRILKTESHIMNEFGT